MKNNVLFFLFLTTIRVAMVCLFLSFFLSIRAPTRGAICQKRQQSATIAFQSAHLREVRLLRGCRQSTIMTFQSAHLHEVRFFTIGIHFTILVSIRAPTQGAMATQSKIRPIRGLTPPHRSQNRRILGNPSPQWHPCARPLREKRHRFYDHLWIALECFLAHLTVTCVAVVIFGRPRQTTFLWSNHVAQPSDAFDLTRQSTTSPNLSFSSSTKHHLQKV